MTGVGAGPEPTRGPVFVVGSMRSGSTMLRLMLDSHPSIAIGGETGFMGAVLATKQIPNWRMGKGWYERLNWTEEEVDERLRGFYDGMFRRYAAEQGKPRWGEKTPFHTAHIAEMAQVFPDAVFVGIVRHPGAVAASLRRTFHYRFPDAVGYWLATNLDLVRGATLVGDRFLLCRYEDVVLDGEPVLREVTEFLGEPWHRGVLEHHRVQREKGTARAAEGGTVAHEAVDARRAVRWTDDADEEDRAALEVSAELARFFGYDPVDPAVLERLDADVPRWTVAGDDLARRRKEWSARVDFDERPATLAIDASPEELSQRLAQAERALARVRSRKAVRLGDALRRAQHGRSLADLRQVWAVLREPRTEGGGR